MTIESLESVSGYFGDFGGSFETLKGDCATHGNTPTLVRAGKAWHCRHCFEAKIKAE